MHNRRMKTQKKLGIELHSAWRRKAILISCLLGLPELFDYVDAGPLLLMLAISRFSTHHSHSMKCETEMLPSRLSVVIILCH